MKALRGCHQFLSLQALDVREQPVPARAIFERVALRINLPSVHRDGKRSKNGCPEKSTVNSADKNRGLP